VIRQRGERELIVDPLALELFGQKLSKSSGGQALHRDSVAVGLVNSIHNRSARVVIKGGVELDSIAGNVFRAKGDQSSRSRIYSGTLSAGREHGKISNLHQSLVSMERQLLRPTPLVAAAIARWAPAQGKDASAARSSRTLVRPNSEDDDDVHKTSGRGP
jgi:hypothetical protein